MKQIRVMMGMPITVEIASEGESNAVANEADFAAVFDYFSYIDYTFSTYKLESEIMKINRGELVPKEWSDDMAIIFALAEETKQRTGGFFDIKKPDGSYDPSGIVKGWAILKASKILEERGFENFYIDAGGDIQTRGRNGDDEKWSVGIKNPFKQDEVVKTIYVSGEGVATSGTYLRGEHIYNPKNGVAANEIASMTLVGVNVYEADRFATAAFAMGLEGIHFVEKLNGIEGYMIDKNGMATMTTGFEKYIK